MFNPNNVTGIASVAAIEALGVSAPLYPNVYLYTSNINYYWNPTSTTTPDNVLVIQCTGVTTGRYLAVNTIFPPVSVPFIQNYKTGLILSTAGSTGTFGITSGLASDTTNISLMTLVTAYTKTTSAWALGTGNGSLDTGSIANTTWYHVFLIQRPDTGVTDILTSLSTTPTLPTNYTLFRRIGSMKTDSSAHWVLFSQLGNQFLWGTPVEDINGATSGVSTAQSITLTVPTGIKVDAKYSSAILSSSIDSAALYVSSFDQNDVAASSGTAFTLIQSGGATLGGSFASGQITTRTNTSAQVRFRFLQTDTTYYVNTYGWTDTFGQ